MTASREASSSDAESGPSKKKTPAPSAAVTKLPTGMHLRSALRRVRSDAVDKPR